MRCQRRAEYNSRCDSESEPVRCCVHDAGHVCVVVFAGADSSALVGGVVVVR